ncbi:MAG: transcriptional regulator [Deltaproteobacteria bacterium]|jgi:HTH-type transcriptional regulator/antitoxin HigA|nr:transcriptional regulator [Deltaproteobacteria bacterium]
MIKVNEVTKKYLEFSASAASVLNIENEDAYHEALKFLEALLEQVADDKDDPLIPLIDLVSRSIENYEMKQDDIRQFVLEAEGKDSGIVALKVLMRQYELSFTDLKQEVGSKTLVSMILSGQRSLTKSHIEKLSKRFHVSPSLFFDEGAWR